MNKVKWRKYVETGLIGRQNREDSRDYAVEDSKIWAYCYVGACYLARYPKYINYQTADKIEDDVKREAEYDRIERRCTPRKSAALYPLGMQFCECIQTDNLTRASEVMDKIDQDFLS